MRTIIVSALTGVLIACLTSCGKENNDSQKLNNTDAPVVTAEVTDVTSSSAILYGYVTTDSSIMSGFIVSTSASPSSDNGQMVEAQGGKDGKYFAQLFDLTSSTTYYYRAFTRTKTTILVGDVKSFTTMDFKFAAIDLGLSVKWANANLGSSAPEGNGDYYAWGETETKENYNWRTYKWCLGNTSPVAYPFLTKYYIVSIEINGTVDNKTFLEAEDDVAHVKLGGKWRMPTDAEWKELYKNCTWTPTTQSGVNGYKVTSKTNGKSIFLPAACLRIEDHRFEPGPEGFYWSSSLYTEDSKTACCLYFESNGVSTTSFVRVGANDRYLGLPVRPVSD